MKHFKKSIKEAAELFKSLESLEESMALAVETIEKSLLGGGKLLLCGNGGSAMDAAHAATEFVCRFKADRRPYPALALGCDGGLLTAIANDYEFRDVFSRQVRALGRAGDVLIGISTSGKSRNVLEAIEEGRRNKLKTIALLGRSGGFTAGAAEIEIVVPSEETARIQEAHKFLLHAICQELEDRLPAE